MLRVGSVQVVSRPRSGERSERSLDAPERSRTIQSRSGPTICLRFPHRASGALTSQRRVVDTSHLNIYRDHMDVELTREQHALIRRAIEGGRLNRGPAVYSRVHTRAPVPRGRLRAREEFETERSAGR
jgi:hypothetical protein